MRSGDCQGAFGENTAVRFINQPHGIVAIPEEKEVGGHLPRFGTEVVQFCGETIVSGVGEEGSDDVINVGIGFQTDFASIPRLLWAFLPQWGKYGNAAVIHDWLYWDQRRGRRASDDIFLEGMKVLEVSAWKRNVIYYAVRAFGGFAWRSNRSRRQ